MDTLKDIEDNLLENAQNFEKTQRDYEKANKIFIDALQDHREYDTTATLLFVKDAENNKNRKMLLKNLAKSRHEHAQRMLEDYKERLLYLEKDQIKLDGIVHKIIATNNQFKRDYYNNNSVIIPITKNGKLRNIAYQISHNDSFTRVTKRLKAGKASDFQIKKGEVRAGYVGR